ncbi:polysialyltransferase family glycosyltransferase [Ruminococcus gauvreauii]|uniref:Alpha-2,8-polysialyltransferase family protein n=1 Tax=Ruminococcus gauvreauii TaxID=438033 RepID=A0ABY5VFI4_9FIRM|nr:polysialyltransferase family glycosyltransferase [Ruminococcus gauvreauii]UWP59032.1 alpha-2,8-polysialyltransferase family protein [Ruminococcus gauvreauii]
MTLVEITRHELEKNIFSNKYGELDFYAYCNTPWHAIGIQSFVNNLSEKKQKLSGIVFLANQPGRDTIVHPEDFSFKSNVDVLYFKNIDAYREDKKNYLKKLLFSKNQVVLTNDNNIYMLRPFRPDYKFGAEYQIETGRKCVLVCLEEGVGTYKSNYELFQEKTKGSLKAGALFALTCCFNSYLKTKYKLNISSFTLLKKEKDSLSLNNEIANMYLESIQRAVNRRNIKYNSCIDTTRDYVIILTQPFEIKQDVVCKDIINREFDLVKEYLSQKGVDVYIKSHPRETEETIDNYRNRGFNILQSNIPIETFLEMLPKKPIAVIGAVSTALITANALNKVVAISVVDLIKKESDSSYLKAAIKFKRRYSYFVRFPQKIEQILGSGCKYED